MTKIAFVDSQRDDLAPVRTLLTDENHVVETFRDGKFALECFQRRMPDLVVINLPTFKIDGVTLLDRIRAVSIIPIVMLSAVRDEIDEIMGLRFGADDYIQMPVSPRLLAERIKALLRRHAALLAHSKMPAAIEKTLVCGDLIMDPSRHDVIWKGVQISMTVTEFQMLQALAHRPGIVKTRDQLISASYSDEAHVDDRTIDSHIKRIRKKLRVIDPNFNGIQTLYGVGYRFTPASEPPLWIESKTAAVVLNDLAEKDAVQPSQAVTTGLPSPVEATMRSIVGGPNVSRLPASRSTEQSTISTVHVAVRGR